MTEQTPIRVLLVDDHEMLRDGLAVFLENTSGLEKAGEATSGEEAIRLCDELKPDVVLMDLVMPGMDGIAATQIIKQNHPEIKIIALTSYSDSLEYVPAALEAGATGYLFKDISPANLARAIKTVYEGESVLATEATNMLVHTSTLLRRLEQSLTERELEVLSLLVKGLNNSQIAARLNINQSTVKTHVSNILTKLDVKNRAEAVAVALQHKLVS